MCMWTVLQLCQYCTTKDSFTEQQHSKKKKNLLFIGIGILTNFRI